MRCTILASGSKGNCVFLEGGSGALLLDAGLSTKEALRRMDKGIPRFRADPGGACHP